MTNLSTADKFRRHIAQKSFSGSAHDSPLKDDLQSLYYQQQRREEFPVDLLKQQGRLRDQVIEQMDRNDLQSFGMLTIRPDKHLSLDKCRDLACSIDKALEKRYNPRQRQTWGSPHLTFYEKDQDLLSWHIHILFSLLPTDQVLNKKTLTYPVLDAVREVSGGKDRLTNHQLFDPKWHKELIDFAIRTPWDWINNQSFYKGFRYLPKGKKGLVWTLADDGYEWNGFVGWRGLVAYVTKDLFTGDQMMKGVDERTMKRLKMEVSRVNSHTGISIDIAPPKPQTLTEILL